MYRYFERFRFGDKRKRITSDQSDCGDILQTLEFEDQKASEINNNLNDHTFHNELSSTKCNKRPTNDSDTVSIDRELNNIIEKDGDIRTNKKSPIKRRKKDCSENHSKSNDAPGNIHKLICNELLLKPSKIDNLENMSILECNNRTEINSFADSRGVDSSNDDSSTSGKTSLNRKRLNDNIANLESRTIDSARIDSDEDMDQLQKKTNCFSWKDKLDVPLTVIKEEILPNIPDNNDDGSDIDDPSLNREIKQQVRKLRHYVEPTNLGRIKSINGERLETKDKFNYKKINTLDKKPDKFNAPSGEKVHRCRHCHYTRRNKEQVLRHELLHSTTKPYKCDGCYLSFSEYWRLKQHKVIHSGQKRYKCRYCDYSSLRSGNLKCHERTHINEKAFKCDQCDFASNQTYDLIQHMRRHSGEKPYKCDQCQRRFTRSYALTRHKRTHENEKPFKCNQCHYSCSRKSSLKLHAMNYHSVGKPQVARRVHTCRTCGFVTNQKWNLFSHQKTHRKEQPYLVNKAAPKSSVTRRDKVTGTSGVLVHSRRDRVIKPNRNFINDDYETSETSNEAFKGLNISSIFKFLIDDKMRHGCVVNVKKLPHSLNSTYIKLKLEDEQRDIPYSFMTEDVKSSPCTVKNEIPTMDEYVLPGALSCLECDSMDVKAESNKFVS